MNVEIEYCVPCGHLGKAMDTQQQLLEAYGQQLETVALRTGTGGVFKIRVEGEEVLDAQRDGFDLDRVRAVVDDRLAA